MKTFVGIDLGTTNSAICSFDGTDTRIWKSPEQNDVTPSAIYIDRRGNKYVGKRAYDSAPLSPDNAALLFKRFMGTSTPINLSAVNLVMTPEECSAEIIKTLFGYLPEEIRNDADTGTVITVPAAFNQMQKAATMQAAHLAGIGKVALMQEPVAAIMSIMQHRSSDGIFLVFDLGGGTLDIAIAESIAGHVSLLAHGGIQMCGGRDFDRGLFDNIVKPWLFDKFNLPDNLSVNREYKSLVRLSTWAAEKAKIELSAKEETVISLTEIETRARDLNGQEIYLDIPLDRRALDAIISERVKESINAARTTINQAGLSGTDIELMVFIGGPTNYKPLRDKVSFELGIPGSVNVNPMTAVAEGAAIFAESIDWNTKNRNRKSNRGQLCTEGDMNITWNYVARTPEDKAKIAIHIRGTISPGAEFQIDNIDTGWTSGRLALKQDAVAEVALPQNGENCFKVSIYDSFGGAITLKEDRIVITKTATIDAIPASHAIGVEVLERLGGKSTLDWLIKAGESLPKKGHKVYKAAEALKAGSSGSLNFTLWEGEIEDPVTYNRRIGTFTIRGSDFDDGVITAGADLVCDYEILDSGIIVIEISVPQIGATFKRQRNFYNYQSQQMDFSTAGEVVQDDGKKILRRLEEVARQVDDPQLDEAREKLDLALSLDESEPDPEKTQEARERVQEAKKILAQVKKDNLPKIREIELNDVVDLFEKSVSKCARPSEQKAFDTLIRTARAEIDRKGNDFEKCINEMRGKIWGILWRQDYFIIDWFRYLISSPQKFIDRKKFVELSTLGARLLKDGDIDQLRQVVVSLSQIQVDDGDDDDILAVANIIRG